MRLWNNSDEITHTPLSLFKPVITFGSYPSQGRRRNPRAKAHWKYRLSCAAITGFRGCFLGADCTGRVRDLGRNSRDQVFQDFKTSFLYVCLFVFNVPSTEQAKYFVLLVTAFSV